MRVTHVLPEIDESYGGPARSVPLLCSATVTCGVEPTIVSTVRGPWQNETVETEKVGVVLTPMSRPQRLGYAKGLRSAIVGSRPDVIHVHGVWRYPAYAAYSASVRLSVPLIVSARSNLMQPSLVRSAMVKKAAQNLFVNRLLDHATKIHCTTSAEMDGSPALDRYQEKCFVVPNVVEHLAGRLPSFAEAAEMLDISPQRRYVLYIGRLNTRKRIDLLISSFMQAKLDVPGDEWRLIIAGSPDSSLGGEVREQFEFGEGKVLPAAVQYIGSVTGKRRLAAFAVAELYSSASMFENFGMSTVEALGSGLPVVTFRDAFPFDVNGGPVLRIAEDENDFVAALREMMETPRTDASAVAAMRLFDELTQDGVAERYCALYHEVCGQSPAGA